MGDHSTIEWTEATWNPLTGCTRVSAGCDNCYAATQAAGRLKNTPAYEVLAVVTPSGRAAFNGKIRLLPDRLDQPLRWKRPRRVFVNSMSDLFHPDVPDEFIDRVFAVMAMAPQHTFQVLTKRPERMAEYMVKGVANRIERAVVSTQGWSPDDIDRVRRMPLLNVWLGTSVENQTAVDERVPHLLRTPAAVRFLSCEPLLGPIELPADWQFGPKNPDLLPLDGEFRLPAGQRWVIIGGESGRRARPFDVVWARDLIHQCTTAGVDVFVKQLGAHVRDRNDAGFDAFGDIYVDTGMPTNPTAWPEPLEVEHDPDGFREGHQGAPVRVRLRDSKGGDMDEWPADLRVREIPTAPTALVQASG